MPNTESHTPEDNGKAKGLEGSSSDPIKMEENNTETALSLMAKVIQDDNFNTDQKIKLLDEIRKARPALEDRWIYRWIVYFLGSTVILTVLGGFIMVMLEASTSIPDGLIALGSAALGALATLLSNRSKADDES